VKAARLELELSDREAAIVGELRRLAFVRSDAAVVRLALWRLAAHYDVPIAATDFITEAPRRRRSTGNG
jgi:hypothetical protein